jgi:hypothetical protein
MNNGALCAAHRPAICSIRRKNSQIHSLNQNLQRDIPGILAQPLGNAQGAGLAAVKHDGRIAPPTSRSSKVMLGLS